MYDFTKKEIREKFKKTEYAKKLNKRLNVSIIFCVILVLIAFIFAMLVGSEVYEIKEELFNEIITDVKYIVGIEVIILSYFYGKRDGAIEQYKISLKK